MASLAAMRKVVGCASIIALALAAACGTSAVVGDACTGLSGIGCRDAHTALDCFQDRVREVPCPGPAGCADGGHVTCDVSTAAAGAPCISFTLGRCTSATAAILCTDQVLTAMSCNVSCVVTASSLTCESAGP
jgi:hypothetical protein